MRLRYRKKVIDRQSLFNIHIAKFIAELNQTVEEAYKSLDEVLDSVEGETDDEGLRDRSLEDTTDRPSDNL
jgi:hypothetical protein